MNYQLIKYYKDTYTDDFNKYFHQECNSDDIIVSTLVPKTMGYPAKNPSESIFFASITWFISLIPQVIGKYCGMNAMLYFHRVAEWPVLLENNNIIHPFHTLASSMLLPEMTCCKMANVLNDCEELMIPSLRTLLPELFKLFPYNISEHINEISNEISQITAAFKNELRVPHKWPWFDRKVSSIYRPFPIYYYKFGEICSYIINDESYLKKSPYYQYISRYFIDIDK